KGSEAHSPASKSGSRLVSPLKISLVVSGKSLPTSHPVSQAKTYACAAATRSRHPEGGVTAAALADTSVCGSECCKHSACSEHRAVSPASSKDHPASRSRSNTRAARSLTYKSDRVASIGEGSVRSCSPSGSSASRLSVSVGGASAVRPKTFKDTVRAIISPDDNSMELVLQISSYSALPQRISHDATSKMAASPDIMYSTPKMATATSSMATTTFKAAIYNPNMPPELAEDLPP
ncbi:Hypothetical predicted protein, partial [Pelobates cultripes]